MGYSLSEIRKLVFLLRQAIAFNGNHNDFENTLGAQMNASLTPVSRGVFSGTFALTDSLCGGVYSDLIQTEGLTLAVGLNPVLLGIDYVKITANGTALSVPGTWKNMGSVSISTNNGDVNRITVINMANEIQFIVVVN